MEKARSFIAGQILNRMDQILNDRGKLTVLRPRQIARGNAIHTPVMEAAMDASTAHLAPAQVLQGQSHEFVIKGPLGYGEFTETYLAHKRITGKSRARQPLVPIVIKIPRVPYDVSDDVATKRLNQLKAAIKGHAQELGQLTGAPSVAQMVDCGDYVHRLRQQPADSSFVAYEYVEGALNLATFMTKHYADAGAFTGLKRAQDFAEWAKRIVQGLLEIHNRRAVHGDICPDNILVRSDGSPVFIDIGQWLFHEVMNGAKEFSSFFYRAPGGVGSPRGDVFSVGCVLYFLSTGKEPIGLGDYTDIDALKRHVELKIKKANPTLYRDDAGVAEIIAMCIGNQARGPHLSEILEELDTCWPGPAPVSISTELRSLNDLVKRLDKQGSSLYRSVAGAHIRSFRRVLSEMTKGNLDVSDSHGRNEMRRVACTLLNSLGSGDEFITVSIPPFWAPENIGIKGKFLSRCQKAAGRGASVRRVFLLEERLSDKHLQPIVAAQLKAASDIDPTRRVNFAVRYIPMSHDERRRRLFEGQHFGMLVKGNDRIAMFPVYDADDVLIALRFRSAPREVEGLREMFEALWSERRSRPLVDLSLQADGVGIDPLEGVG